MPNELHSESEARELQVNQLKYNCNIWKAERKMGICFFVLLLNAEKEEPSIS